MEQAPRRLWAAQRVLQDTGRGVLGALGAAAIVAVVIAVVNRSLNDLPWPWLLAGVAVGLALLGTADLVAAWRAHQRVLRADAFLRSLDEEE